MKNRLKDALSPYLTQHAENPVDWHAWGPEAFDRAAESDKPIFLSIGYSTCHWCHVMAHESFADPEVAELMNETFICIKVDREERPDIDQVYMTVCQMLTGSGGWPLTILMTPDKKPFYAATYIPKKSRFGRPGLMDLVPQVKRMWENNRQSLLQSADQLMASVQQFSEPGAQSPLSGSVLDSAYEILETAFDEKYGGFGGAPKFPTPHNLMFLLRYWNRTGIQKSLHMVKQTLINMRRGGIYDQLGYGFHRYATDKKWQVPHFEKMLYDQALISMVYAEAFQATGEPLFIRTVNEIYQYVLSELTSAQGAFFSAEDADSDGMEGGFYLWRTDEIQQAFSKEDSDRLIKYFNLESNGNYRDEVSADNSQYNILYMADIKSDPSGDANYGLVSDDSPLGALLQKLCELRSTRKRPFRDEKILVDWNGLMIASLAKSARSGNRSDLAAAAAKAAKFILTQMKHPDGGLFHVFLNGRLSARATLNDYAFMVWGLLELYEATFDLFYLESALDLNRYMIDHFEDTANGGFFPTDHRAEKLLLRNKEIYDGAVPSGNSVALMNLIRIFKITADPNLEDVIEKSLDFFAGDIVRYPASHAMFLSAYDFILGPSCEIVVTGRRDDADIDTLLNTIFSVYLPNSVVLFHDIRDNSRRLRQYCSLIENMKAIDNSATVYICSNFTCEQPETDPLQLKKRLESIRTHNVRTRHAPK